VRSDYLDPISRDYSVVVLSGSTVGVDAVVFQISAITT
jgi:hypothetical protein